MRNRTKFVSYALLCPFALISIAYAADESFVDQFIGSPLLVLATIIVIDIIALVYHKIRK